MMCAPALHEPGTKHCFRANNSCNALMLGVHDDWSVLPNHTFVAMVRNVVCYDNDVGHIVGFASMRAPVERRIACSGH